jgi:capsular exopolysaccharide synthesis family protein
MNVMSSSQLSMKGASPLQITEHDKPIIDFLSYWRIINRYKWSIIIITIIVASMSIFMGMKTTPIYQATAKIQADPVQPNATANDQYIMNSMVFLFYETQYEIIQSRKIAETVVDKLGLVARYKKEQAALKLLGDDSNFIGDLSASIKSSIKELISSDDSEPLDVLPPTDEQLRIMLAYGIQAMLSVDGGKQSQIINISYQSDDPAEAAEVINAVADAYISFGLEARLSSLKDTAKWLGDQLEDLKITLQTSEDNLSAVRTQSGLMDSEQQARNVNTQLSSLNAELVRAQTQLSQAQEMFSQVQKLDRSKGDYLSLGPVLQNPTIRDLVREESNQSRQVEELSERYGEKHPKLIAARSDLAGAKNNLNREVDKIVENIAKEYRLAQVQLNNVEDLIAKTKAELQSFQGSSFEITRLEREVENNRRVYESFLGRLMEADVSGDYDASNVRIIDRATVPSFPIKPRIINFIVIGIIFGIFIGVIFAFLREALGNVFRTPDQIEEQLQIPSLGITPLVKKNKQSVEPEKQYITDQRSTFAEAINTIRTGLLFSDIDNPPKTVLITSTVGSEGKTTLAINLAVAFSQLDKTLLIELDLRKPAIAKDLGLTNTTGLSDVLTGEVNIKIKGDELTKVAGAPNLRILTCGSIPPNPMELLSSKRFANLLESLKGQFTHIIIDSPPTLPVSDAAVLSKLADATVIAVKAEGTKINMAKETVTRLSKVNANITGVVLTQASPQKMSYYGEHYYQEGYYGVEKS